MFFLFLALAGPVAVDAAKNPSVAVVENQFDNIQKILSVYRIPYKILSMKDLEKEQACRNYKVVFFPCGLGKPVETSINILAYGTSIRSVSLNQDFYQINSGAVCENIGEFINGGGCAYFSGYAFTLLQKEFDIFTFFDDFPYQGTAGRIELTLKGDLKNFIASKKIGVHAAHSGWVTIKSVKDAELMAEGVYDTPRGKRQGPMMIHAKKGKGEVIYTAFHSDDPSHPVARFLIMRLINRELLSDAEQEADKWDHQIGTRITDSLLPWEHFRVYSVDFIRGYNTLYVNSKGYYHLDIYDPEGKILASNHTWERSYAYSVKVPRAGVYGIRIFPALDTRLVPFAVVAGYGRRILPYWRFITLGVLLMAGAASLYILSRVLNPRKYSGRLR